MIHRRRSPRLLATFLGLSLVLAACGDDDESSDDEGTDTEQSASSEASSQASGDESAADDADDEADAEGAAGGELIDAGTFVGDPPEHIDPALNVTLDAYQVVNAVFDGLTDIDASDPENPSIVPHIADEVTPNDDATVWTFHIREGAQFADGEEINASTFQNSWERASDPDFAGDYSYLFNFIDGGAEKLDGTADTLSGVEADDESRTLTVTLDAPYSNFDAVAGFQLFFPVPQAAIDDPAGFENGEMFGNGPYQLEGSRTDEEIVLVPNENWQGDFEGDTHDDRLERITFLTTPDPDTSYNSFEAGEADTANIPPGRTAEADENWGTTLDVQILGSYHFEIRYDDPVVGGAENRDLRVAISQAIDREEINEAVYDGTRTLPTGITPPGIPGFGEDLCEYCSYDPEAAQAAFDAWTAAGHSQTEPIRIQFNAGAGHEDVVAIMVENLAAIGIQAEADPRSSETYFSELADGACQICRSGWFADYPAYDNFMYDLFHTDAIGGNNHGMYSNPAFDDLVNEAKQTTDDAEQAELFHQAEQVLLNDDVGVIPINWYRGDYAYNDEKITNFPQTNFGLILWEEVTLAE